MKHLKLFEELTKKSGHCDRCDKPTRSVTGSFLDTDMICSECEEAEKNEPDYLVAKRRELEEVKKGNLNYKGWRNEMND
jgi:hypothetical protein